MKKLKILLLFLTTGILISCGSDDNNPTPDPEPDPTGLLGEIDFVKTYGGSDEDDAVTILPSNDGGYMVVGSTKSNDGDITDKTGTDSDYWLLKLNAQGEKVWSKTFGGSEDDIATSMTATSDGGYIISGYSRSNDGDVSGNEGFHDFWILKIDANGNKQWDKNFGFSGSDQAYKILETSQGNYFVSGFLDVTASGGQGNDLINGQNNTRNLRHGVGEYWGVLLDNNGNKLWRRYFGGGNNDRSYDAVQANDGGFIMIGASESNDFDITDSKGSYDFWAVKLNQNGDLEWTKSFGGSEIDIAYAATNTVDNNYIMVGDTRSTDQDVTSSNGNADAWIVKFDDNGNKIWQKNYGGSEFDSARAIKPIEEGKFLVVGNTRSNNIDVSNNNGQNDCWILIISSNGTLEFEMTVGGSSLDFANDVLQTPDKKIIFVGNTESNNLDIPQNRGIKDLIITKIK